MKQATTETTETQALAVREAVPLPVAKPVPSAVDILQAAMQHGITEANVAVVERMAALVERQQDRQAERDYAVALANLQKDCALVVATKDVDGKFRYAPFLDIWQAVRPHVEANGFTLQWDQEHLGDRIKKKLTLQHVSGHKTSREWTIRLGTNAPGTPTGSQAPVLDEIADSRAKRRLLMDALNIVVDAISPAEDVGDGTLASPEEAEALRARLLALGGDAKRFLAYAEVQDWQAIPKVAVPILSRLLAEKERAAKQRALEPRPAASPTPTAAPQASQAALPLSAPTPPATAVPQPQQQAAPRPPAVEDRNALVKRLWELTAPYRAPEDNTWTSTRAWLTNHNLLDREKKVSQCSAAEIQAMITIIETM
jgi:hypothetical protein